MSSLKCQSIFCPVLPSVGVEPANGCLYARGAMGTTQGHALARIKLSELYRQQRRLSARYDELERLASDETIPLPRRIVALLDGLDGLSFARTMLHPEVGGLRGQLSVLLLESSHGREDRELMERALVRLTSKLKEGRMRVTFSHLFGCWIEEHLASLESGTRLARPAETDASLATMRSGGVPLGDTTAWLTRAFASRPRALRSLSRRLSEQDEPLAQPPGVDLVRWLLKQAASDANLAPSTRAAAAQASRAEGLVGELADVLSILLEHLGEWSWPAEGSSLWVKVEHGKPRLMLEEGLVDALFVKLMGEALSKALREWWQSAGEPVVASKKGEPHGSLFFPTVSIPIPESLDEPSIHQFLLASLRNNLDHRLSWSSYSLVLASLDASSLSDYDAASGDSPSRQDSMFGALHTYLRCRRAIEPGAKVWVLRFDFLSFFANVSHEAVLSTWRWLGLAPVWLRAIEAYLSALVRVGDRVERLTRGLLVGRRLSWVLVEPILLALDLHLHDAIGLRSLRVGDDFFVVASSAEQAEKVRLLFADFSRDWGLPLNEGKGGVTCVGGPENTGESLARWGALCLHPDGVFRPDPGKIESLRCWTADHCARASSVLDQVVRYNTEAHHLARGLGLRFSLDGGHPERATRSLLAFHQGLFGPGQGIVEAIQRRALELQGAASPVTIPAALLYWPKTAGGLGLMQPMIWVREVRRALSPRLPAIPESQASFVEELAGLEPASRKPQRIASLAIKQAELWQCYWSASIAPLPSEDPEMSDEMNALVQDFIRRGSELGERTQQGLRAYWQHALLTYGPAVLDAVGTFRFLLTEMVPLSLLFGGAQANDASG